jgi:hypothetical protein
MNTLKSKEFQINVSKQKLEDEISCLRTKLNLAKMNQMTILNAIESHKECQAQVKIFYNKNPSKIVSEDFVWL